MIVSCPQCYKQYRIDATAVNYIQIPDGKGALGVRLACSNCNNYWWESKPINLETNYQAFNYNDLTDVSGLFHSQAGSNKNQDQNKNKPFADRLLLRKTIKGPAPFTKKHLLITGISFLALVTISISVIFWDRLTENYAQDTYNSSLDSEQKILKSKNTNKYNNTSKYNKGLSTLPKTKELSIKDIRYEVRQESGYKRILVTGEITNPDQKAVPVPKINIVVWGPCGKSVPNNQDLQSNGKNSAGNKCIVNTWNYQWQIEQLLPSERLLLESSGQVSQDIEILQVDVDIN